MQEFVAVGGQEYPLLRFVNSDYGVYALLHQYDLFLFAERSSSLFGFCEIAEELHEACGYRYVVFAETLLYVVDYGLYLWCRTEEAVEKVFETLVFAVESSVDVGLTKPSLTKAFLKSTALVFHFPMSVVVIDSDEMEGSGITAVPTHFFGRNQPVSVCRLHILLELKRVGEVYAEVEVVVKAIAVERYYAAQPISQSARTSEPIGHEYHRFALICRSWGRAAITFAMMAAYFAPTHETAKKEIIYFAVEKFGEFTH